MGQLWLQKSKLLTYLGSHSDQYEDHYLLYVTSILLAFQSNLMSQYLGQKILNIRAPLKRRYISTGI
jgi:hypothetical protein